MDKISVYYFISFGWGLCILLSFIGWGSLLKDVVLPKKDIDWGQRAAWGVALSILVEGDFLMFDESLMSVDMGFAEKCKSYFKNLLSSDKTVIMTFHNTHFLNEYCKIALWIDSGRIRMSGEVGDVINAYESSFRIP